MITPKNFPGTTADVSFTNNVKNVADGYKPYEGLSTFSTMQLQTLNNELGAAIDKIESEHDTYCDGAGKNTPECTDFAPNAHANNELATVTDNTPGAPTGFYDNTTSTLASTTGNAPSNIPNSALLQNTSENLNSYCAMRQPNIPNGQKLPLGIPLSPNVDLYNKIYKNLYCSGFAVRRSATWSHHGIDIGCNKRYLGQPVFATADGVVRSVVYAKACKSPGNMISISHADGYISYYMHLDTILVTQGQQVQAGCLIGTMGHTGGNKTQSCPKMGPELTHLHYELRNKKKPAYMNTPKGPIKLQYLGSSFNPLPMLQYK